MDELLGLNTLYLAFSLGWVLLGHGPFLLSSNPCLLCGSADTSAMPPHCLCHVAFWFVLTGPPLGLPHTFPFTQFMQPSTFAGIVLKVFWASSTHSNPSFKWAFAKSFGLPQPNYHILYFQGLLASLPTSFTNSFIWAPLAHFYLLSICHNSHGFITFFGLPWIRLLSLGLLTILQAHGPLFLPFGINGFLLTLLILLPYCLPYCWAFSCYWAFLPKWASTTFEAIFIFTIYILKNP